MKFQVTMVQHKHVDVTAADMRSAIAEAIRSNPDYSPTAVDSLESDEGDDYLGKCESCGTIILGNDNYTEDEDCIFCEKCGERQMAG